MPVGTEDFTKLIIKKKLISINDADYLERFFFLNTLRVLTVALIKHQLISSEQIATLMSRLTFSI